MWQSAGKVAVQNARDAQNATAGIAKAFIESDEEEDTDAITMQIMMGLMLAYDEDKEDIR